MLNRRGWHMKSKKEINVETVRQIMVNRGTLAITAAELAAKIGVSERTVNRYVTAIPEMRGEAGVGYIFRRPK